MEVVRQLARCWSLLMSPVASQPVCFESAACDVVSGCKASLQFCSGHGECVKRGEGGGRIRERVGVYGVGSRFIQTGERVGGDEVKVLGGRSC